MKRYLNPISDGGAPIFLDDLISSDSETYTALNAIVSGFGEPVVLSGCELSNINPVGFTVDISAGVVFIDGEVRESPAYSGSYPVYLEPSADLIETRDFEDGTTEDVFVTKSAIYSASLPGVEHIKFNPTTKSRFSDVLKRATTKTGEIIMQSVSSSFFDGTGLGFDEYDGFALCNGSNGTVDLKGRFIVGQDAGNVDYDNIGDTGGAESVTLTGQQSGIKAHTPQIDSAVISYDTGGNVADVIRTFQASNGLKNLEEVPNASASQSHENRPPYFTLAYIQRV
jgi:microcystin-dependent protein